MIYKHIRTGVDYRHIAEAFDVQTQRPSIVYVSLKNGQMFVRDREIFNRHFQVINLDPQSDIAPTPPKPPLEEQLEMFQ